MRLVRFDIDGIIKIGKLENTTVYEILEETSIMVIIEYGKLSDLLFSKKGIELSRVSLLPPIQSPKHDVICVGKNYIDHIKELGGSESGEFIPNYFSKRCCNFVGHNQSITWDTSIVKNVDYEVELMVIIGKRLFNASIDDAREGIFGITIFNDLTSRYLQHHHKQWYRGKSIEGFSIMGPAIVTSDEIEFPIELDIRSYINDELRQNSNTRNMLINPEEIIADLSRTMVLEPGDMIATGTPSGVGAGFDPPQYLSSGDTIRMEIEKIGILQSVVSLI